MAYSRVLKVTSPLMYGTDVKEVQGKLNSKGFNCGTVDGYYGNNTANAVKSFQGSVGITQDGMVGPITWDKLFNSGTSNDIGWNYITPVSTDTPDLYTLSVKIGGDYPAGYYYRMYSHGQKSNDGGKIWYKKESDGWNSGSTKVIYDSIKEVNRCYDVALNALLTEASSSIAKQISDALAMWAFATLEPTPIGEIVTFLKGVGIAADIAAIVELKSLSTATINYVASIHKLNYHWKRI